MKSNIFPAHVTICVYLFSSIIKQAQSSRVNIDARLAHSWQRTQDRTNSQTHSGIVEKGKNQNDKYLLLTVEVIEYTCRHGHTGFTISKNKLKQSMQYSPRTYSGIIEKTRSHILD